MFSKEKERKVIWRAASIEKERDIGKEIKRENHKSSNQTKKRKREKWKKKKKKSTSAVTIADEQQDLDRVTAYDETGVQENTRLHT